MTTAEVMKKHQIRMKQVFTLTGTQNQYCAGEMNSTVVVWSLVRYNVNYCYGVTDVSLSQSWSLKPGQQLPYSFVDKAGFILAETLQDMRMETEQRWMSRSDVDEKK